MSCIGIVKGGVVVLEDPYALPEGTRVKVEALRSAPAELAAEHDPGEFWQSRTLDELARIQGVAPIKALEDVMGGWPEDKVDDGFEQAVRRWRDEDLESCV